MDAAIKETFENVRRVFVEAERQAPSPFRVKSE
jgi:hypothetical protein